MPEIKLQDYTRSDLKAAAEACRQAAALLQPMSAELTRIVDDIAAERPDDAHFYLRTNRYLLGTANHLQGTAFDLLKVAENAGRPYASAKSRLLGLNLAGWTVAVVIALLKLVLPAHAGNIAIQLAPIGIGFAIGATASLAVLERYVTGKRGSDGRKR